MVCPIYWGEIMKTNSSNQLSTFALRAVLLLTLFALATRCAIHAVSHNYNLSAEANGLYGFLEFSEGRPLYPSRDQKPYHVYLYPPVHALFNGGLVTLLGITEVRAKILVVRLVSFAMLLFVVYTWWRQVIRPRYDSVLAYGVTMLLILSKFTDYATTTRNDLLSLGLEITAVCAFVRWNETRRERFFLLWFAIGYLVFFTRLTGVAVVGAGLLYLLIRRQFLRTGVAAVAYGGLVGATAFAANRMTDGAFFEQVVLANLRPFRPVGSVIIDVAFFSFVMTYLLFAVLAGWGIVRASRGHFEPEKFFIGLCGALSFVLASVVFLRAGGDVNYFFTSIFLFTLFAVEPLSWLLRNRFSSAPSVWKWAIGAQLIAVSVVGLMKSYSAAQVAFLPYEDAARELAMASSPFGFLTGNYAQNMGIHLRGWAVHGPDVTNGGMISRNGDPQLRWILADLKSATRDKVVNSYAIAHPHCRTECKAAEEGPFVSFSEKQCPYDWLCVFSRLKADGERRLGQVSFETSKMGAFPTQTEKESIEDEVGVL